MKKYKFHNETFEINLEFLVLTSDKCKKKAVKHLQNRGFDLSDAKESVNYPAFCTEVLEGGIILLFINLDSFTDCKGGKIESIMYLQHECNHFRNIP